QIRVAAGEVAPVGAVVAVLSSGAASTAARVTQAPGVVFPPPASVRSAPIVLPAPSQTAASSGRPAMLDPFREVRTPERNWGPAALPPGAAVPPPARRLAGEAGTDLAGIVPSGPHGRIVARDVETALAARAGRLARSPAAPSPDRIKALYEPGSYMEIPLDSM